MGITQIATSLNLNKATVWGLVTTLEKQAFLQQDPETLKYSVGPKLFELGMVYLGSLEINAKASRLAHGLASRTHLNARVGIWDGDSVLITLLALPKAEDSISHQLGPRVPAYCSGIGKAMLAFLDPEELRNYLRVTELVRHTRATIVTAEELVKDLEKTRERGYSISREEMIPGMTALGAPIFGRTRGWQVPSVSPARRRPQTRNRWKSLPASCYGLRQRSRAMGYYNTECPLRLVRRTGY